MSRGGLLGGASGSIPEPYAEHRRRLGPVPHADAGFSELLARSGLRGRGGAAFPTAAKWAAVASSRARRPVVLANGAEGEPGSRKDRSLMAARPHLVIDGAVIAAQSVGARDIVLYVGGDHAAALAAMRSAVAERPQVERRLMRLVVAPPGYVSGEETAAVHLVNDGVALPQSVPPRPYERGIEGRPTLVNNVETLAHAALVARFGPEWFVSAGRPGAPGTVLLTLGGAVRRPGVIEVAQGTTIGEAILAAGGSTGECQAVLLGGYFGSWLPAAAAWDTPLDAVSLRAHGHSLGCGVVEVLPARACGAVATSRVLSHLASESAHQCGPCVFGLRAIAATAQRVAVLRGSEADLHRLRGWAGLVAGRGACKHPDGAAQLLRSALSTFGDDLALHATRHRCLASAVPQTMAS